MTLSAVTKPIKLQDVLTCIEQSHSCISLGFGDTEGGLETFLVGFVRVNDVVVSMVELAQIRPPPEICSGIRSNEAVDIAVEYIILGQPG